MKINIEPMNPAPYMIRNNTGEEIKYVLQNSEKYIDLLLFNDGKIQDVLRLTMEDENLQAKLDKAVAALEEIANPNILDDSLWWSVAVKALAEIKETE